MVAHTLRPSRWQTLPATDRSVGIPQPGPAPALPARRVHRAAPRGAGPVPSRPDGRSTSLLATAPRVNRHLDRPGPVDCADPHEPEPYRMGRWARLAMTLTVVAAAAVALSMWIAAPSSAPAVELVTVGAGDTVWSIAVEQRPGADPRVLVEQISELNGLDGGPLLVGSTLQVPVG